MLEFESNLAEIPGAAALIEWFGFIPDFHDAEILDIELSRQKAGLLQFHAFRMTNQLDSSGHYILDRHVLVNLVMEGITDLSLSDFHLPGIVSQLWIKKVGDSFRIAWDASYGVSGTITAKSVRIELDEWRSAETLR